MAIKISISVFIIFLNTIVIQSCKQAEDSSANGIPPSGDKLDFSFKKAKVTFTVDMASQKVLGFFKPARRGGTEEGDGVFLEYSINDSLCKSVKLKKDTNNIYAAEIIFSANNETKPIEYRYKIVTSRKAVLPNNGYENGLRLININKKEMNLPKAYFNNIQKVVRFIINTKKWIEEGKFKPLKDNISIKLFFNGKGFIEPLTKVKKDIYETAVELPPEVKNIEWQVVKNSKVQLSKLNNADIKNYGEVIKL